MVMTCLALRDTTGLALLPGVPVLSPASTPIAQTATGYHLRIPSLAIGYFLSEKEKLIKATRRM